MIEVPQKWPWPVVVQCDIIYRYFYFEVQRPLSRSLCRLAALTMTQPQQVMGFIQKHV